MTSAKAEPGDAVAPRRPRVAIFCDEARWGGIVAYSVALAAGLDPAEFDAVLVAIEPHPWHQRAIAMGARVETLTPGKQRRRGGNAQRSRRPWWKPRPPGRLRWLLGALREIRKVSRLLRRRGFDIVHVQSVGSEMATVAARLSGKAARVVSTFHIVPAYVPDQRRRSWDHRLVQTLAMRAFDHAIAVCTAARDSWIQETGIDFGDRTTVIYNGCAPVGVMPSRELAREQLNVDADATVWLNVANYSPAKGHDLLIEAARRVLVEIPNSVFLLAGAGELEAQLRTAVSDAGLEDRIRLLGYRTDMDTLAAASDFFVLSSVAEAFPMVLLEMGVRGVPVLSTCVGGVPELLTDGVDGTLVPPGDAGTLAATMVRMSIDRDAPQRMAVALQRRVNNQFLTEHMVKATSDVYRRVLAAESGRNV